MKVAYHNKEGLTSGERLVLAKQYEDKGEVENAILIYEKIIRESKLNQNAYDRLMILYRKQKDYKKEIELIGKAVKAFEELYDHSSKKNADKKTIALSKALNKLTGLADRKGRSLYEPEPIGRWKKRKQVAEKRLKKR